MPEPYVISRFFETPLIIQKIEHHTEIASLLTASLATSELDRRDPGIMRLAEQAVQMAARATRDIAQPGTARYRWEWDVRRATEAWDRRSGAFWSFLHSPGAGRKLLYLEDPRLPWILMEEPALRFRDRPGAPPWPNNHTTELEGDEVALFPAWLRHRLDAPCIGIRIDLWALLEFEQTG